MLKLDEFNRIIFDIKIGVVSEVWKPLRFVIIKGTKLNVRKNYEISSYGNVRLDGIQLKPRLRQSGYYELDIAVYTTEGELDWFNIPIHRLVGFVFIDNPENHNVINHRTGIKTRNNYWELEWCTYQDNSTHAATFGLTAKGSKNGTAILSDKAVHEICELLTKNEYTLKTIADRYGVGITTISAIKDRVNWTHISKDYVFNYTSDHKPWDSKTTSKLTESQVTDILQRIIAGESISELAREYETSPQVIHGIKSGDTWKHVYEKFNYVYTPSTMKGSGHPLAKLTESDVHEICKLIVDGKGDSYISRKFNVRRGTIYFIRTKKNWTHVSKLYGI